MKISTVIITFNEEKNIEHCIQKALPVSDEMIILDSFSTDNTADICSKYPVKFIQRAWEGYTLSKNFANSLCQFDWILSLDADEFLSEELQKSILAIKNQEVNNCVFEFRRLPNYCGKWIYHSGWNPDWKVRLFPKSCQWQGEFIHETLTFPAHFKKIRLEGICEHYTTRSVSDHLQTIQKFSDLQAEEMFKQGKKVTFFHIFVKPAFEFFRSYFIKAGILDGKAGFVISVMNSFSKFLKFAKLYNKRNFQ